jgi:citrate lyase subunit beta/citryl-CoA lyase
MVSGHQVKHLNKIDELKADVIMLNLEDGVPKEKKEIAKVMIAIFLSRIEKIDKEIVIRVNPLNEGGLEEIKFLNKFNFNAFRIPKVNSIEDVDDAFMLTDKEIHVSVETKEAFFNLKELKHPKLTTFYIGIYDLLNELKISHSVITLENPLIHKILSDFSLTSRYLNITPIGFVYQRYKDLEGFKKWCLLQKNLGMQGVGCITPAQVDIANAIFSDDAKLAKIIVERFEKEGPFVLEDRGLYVDEPIYKNYLRIVEGL